MATVGPRFGDAGALGAGVLWLGFGVAVTIASVGILFPEMFTKLLHPLRLLHAEWVDARLARLTTTLARFRAPSALPDAFQAP